MPRTLWRGQLTFGLLNIPVRLSTAVRPHKVAFRLLHDDDNVRLETKRVCPQDGQEVPWEHVVKGYEISKDRYVVFTKEELAALEEEPSRAIEIQDFVDLAEVDPVYFEDTYYLVPDEGSERAYTLLREALRRTKRAGVARVVMRGRQRLVAVRVKDDTLVLEMMHFADEVVPADRALEGVAQTRAPSERELAMAEQIVEALSATFDPAQYKDEHRERVLEAVRRKAEGETVTAPPPAPAPAPAAKDLLAALEQSLSVAQRRRKE
jgi:DNA end-binding protein Ku